MHRRRTPLPSGRRPLEVEDAAAAFAINQIAALELLKKRGADARMACAARVADNRRDGHVLALLEDSEEVILEALGKLRLERRGTLLQLRNFGAKIAERVLPGVVRRVPARLQIFASAA